MPCDPIPNRNPNPCPPLSAETALRIPIWGGNCNGKRGLDWATPIRVYIISYMCTLYPTPYILHILQIRVNHSWFLLLFKIFLPNFRQKGLRSQPRTCHFHKNVRKNNQKNKMGSAKTVMSHGLWFCFISIHISDKCIRANCIPLFFFISAVFLCFSFFEMLKWKCNLLRSVYSLRKAW